MLLAAVGTGFGQAPVIINQPQDQTTCIGADATFTVGSTGNEPFFYYWQKSPDGVNYSDPPGCTNATLVITNVQATDAAYYRVTITNFEGAVTSSLALLTLALPPSISSFGQPTNFPIVGVGASVGNRVIASGTVPLSYQWQRNGEPLAGQTKSSIILTNLQVTDAGTYDVVVANMCGSVTSTGRVLVVHAQLPQFTRITAGSIVTDQDGSISGAWGDYDGDGYLDLFVANSWLSGGVRNSLYRNNRDGSFTKMTTNTFLATLGTSSAAAWADLDNDGDLDLVVDRFYSGSSEILFNEGSGVFRPIQTTPGQMLSSGLADMDGDGWLDVFFSNYGGGQNVAYRNQANGTFRKLTSTEAGDLLTYSGVSYVPAWADYDQDGDMDLVVSTSSSVILYRNDGKGKFQKVAVGSLGTETGTCSVQWVDFDNDGWLDVSVVGITRNIGLHRNLRGTNFVSVGTAAGLGASTEAYDSAWGDCDNDGDLDLFVVNEYARNNTFYRNNGDGTFSTVDIGGPIHDGNRDAGVNWVDYDNDGYLDLFIACGDGLSEANLLYHNNGNSNHWLEIKLNGQASNRSGVGAKVRVTATIGGQDVQQTRQVSACGWGAGHGLIAHFGLGDAANVDLLRIEWPSGIVEELPAVAANQILTIVEPSLKGSLEPDGLFHVSMTMSTNRLYQLQTTTNLVDWSVVTNCTGSGSCEPIEYVDPEAPVVGASRYYRLH